MALGLFSCFHLRYNAIVLGYKREAAGSFGSTGTGRFIAVVFDVLNLADPLVIRPITAYDVPDPTE